MGDSSISKELQQINMELTIREYGIPKNTYSRIVYICKCDRICKSTISSLRTTLKRYGNIACRTCRMNQRFVDPESRKKHSEKCKEVWKRPDYVKNHQSGCNEYGKTRRMVINESLLKYLNLDKTVEIYGYPVQGKSPVITICCICSNESKTAIEEIKRAIKKYSDYKCNSCRQKENFKNHDFKIAAAGRAKEFWKDPEYRTKNITSSKNFWTPERRVQESNLLKDRWKTNDEYKESHRQGLLKKWKDPDFIQKMEVVRESSKERTSIHFKSMWKDPEYRERQAQIRAEQLKSRKDSKLETATQSILDSLDMKWTGQFKVGYYVFDLFIPEYNLLIECQGEYWHSFSKNQRRDCTKFNHINDYFPQYNILYLYGHEFNNPEIIRSKIIESVCGRNSTRNILKVDINQLQIKNLDIKKKIEKTFCSESENFLNSFHYAQSGRSAHTTHGLYADNDLLGVCKYSPLSKAKIPETVQTKCSQIVEIDRFCIHPNYDPCLSGQFLEQSIQKMLAENPHIHHIIASSDPAFHKHGEVFNNGE